MLPWVRLHFITSSAPDKRRVRHGERVDACSRTVNDGFCRRVRKAAIAALPVRRRPGVGVTSRRAGSTGPPRVAVHGGARSISAIGNGVVSV